MDEIIVFRALEREQLKEIAGLMLRNLGERLRKTAGFALEWTDEVLSYLAEKGYEPAYGARPLRRLIQQEVETPLSRKIVQGEIVPGSTVKLDRGPDALVFH